MIILIVYEFDIRSDKTKRHPPIAIHPDRPMALQIPFEQMQSETRQIQMAGVVATSNKPRIRASFLAWAA